MAYIDIHEICQKYHQDYTKLWRWIKRGYIKAKKKEVVVKHKVRGGKIVEEKYNRWFIDEESFLDIPAFVRNRGRYNKLINYGDSK